MSIYLPAVCLSLCPYTKSHKCMRIAMHLIYVIEVYCCMFGMENEVFNINSSVQRHSKDFTLRSMGKTTTVVVYFNDVTIFQAY